MNFGIIGYGNIGQLICKNLEDIGFLDENILNLSNRTFSKIESLDSRIIKYDNNVDLVKNSDIIFISVKSPELLDVISEIAPYLDENKYIVHSSAGISFEDIHNIYDGKVSVVIPSIASWPNLERQKTGISIFYHDDKVLDENKQYIEGLFSLFSKVITTDNYDDLEALTIATSCMPAFIALITDLFAKELSNSSNLSYEDIYSYLNETNVSTANLLNLKVYGSEELINKVATKKGITQKGLDYLNVKLPLIFSNLINKLM